MKPAIPWKTAPYAHQREELEAHALDEARGLLWTMRTGKSKAAIDRSAALYLAGAVDLVLVLAPSGVHAQWVEEQVPRHCGPPWTAFAWRSRGREQAGRKASLRAFLAARGTLQWLSANHEALLVADFHGLLQGLLRSGSRIHLVVDESHLFRGAGSKRFRRLRTLAPRCAARTILTGTPSANSVEALYAQFELLEPGALGCRTKKEFLREFIELDWRGHPAALKLVAVGARNLDLLAQRMCRLSSTLRREQCPDLPLLIETERRYEPSRGVVDALDVVRARVDEGDLNPLAALAELQRIACADPLRVTCLRQALAEVSGRAVVWCRFRSDVDRVCAALRGRAYAHSGAISSAARGDSRRAWEMRPDGILVATPETAGVGIDLSAAADMVWYSQVWDATLREQAQERCSRIGGRAVSITTLIGVGTIDEAMLRSAARKRAVDEALARELIEGLR